MLSGATVTDRVYLDLRIGGAPAGRLVIGVHGNSVPRASLNFVELGGRPGEVPWGCTHTCTHKFIEHNYSVWVPDCHAPSPPP